MSLLWEQHCCLPLHNHAEIGELARYQRPGGSYVSVNVGFAPHGYELVRGLIDHWTPKILADERLTTARTVADVDAAAAGDRVAVAFDLEDSGPLDGRLERVQEFYDLGVRTMLPTYNNRNAAGCGCLDAVDDGLSDYGRALVREMNAVGMVVDGSHCSIRTGLDLCAVSEQPVIYSHSCMRSVWDHPRNITDEQARECAATGGVVGITGVGIFLGENDASLDALVRHVDHAVELVGPEHVGLSTDYSFDLADLQDEMRKSPELFPEVYTPLGSGRVRAAGGAARRGRRVARARVSAVRDRRDPGRQLPEGRRSRLEMTTPEVTLRLRLGTARSS
ncbi:dipeptidase [Dactylosporangium sp. CS-047395]|uniref:dipeptidase n=1 Tax=Dactylosporangium sp. CS-047395 TaxID=3239936 RepID=UPI003D947CF5